ncbi:uncharacterized protein [Spinacia oleracea]|uniref:Reverse transcriptase domain-containing protein n=1 Tax=Spinacia oleracea TaxID=3562 RepID=A0A9R0IEW9_SPIOL|nr:uncharacterized protein LOC110787740 [Spinacia oleracea]
MITSHQIKLFSLLERRMKSHRMGDLYLNVYPSWCFTSNISCHKNGRIFVAWDPDSFTVDIIHMDPQMIHCNVTARCSGKVFFCTFVYGMNDRKGREPLWDQLQQLALLCRGAWVVMGGFNALLALGDRLGSTFRETEIQPMRACMNVCRLTEVKTMGRFFTWNNKQDGEDRVFSRIDRVLANAEWDALLENVEATFLPEGEFDHCPMVLSCYTARAQRKPFRFYNMWITAPGYHDLISKNWDRYVYGCPMYRVLQKMKWIKADLRALNKESFSSVEADKHSCYSAFLEAQKQMHADPCNSSLASAERAAGQSYKLANERFISFLQQTAKVHWLQNGDENTRAFHQSIKHKRKKNRIHSIQNQQGVWVKTDEGVQDAFVQFYKSLFCTRLENRTHVQTVIMDKGARLTENHKRKILKEINVASITLVPKVSVPATVGDFRPIACCSVIYKCISKLLCRKLNDVLPDIISPNQGAFVPGRSILHIVLVCQDLVKMYRSSQKAKCSLLKLGLRKAYDIVEWEFIREVMTDLGFPTHFISLIMTCLTTTQYSILINGAPTSLIQPKRGLRQGDPLSPLLFTLCMEYFSRAMITVSEHPHFSFHPRCRRLSLNHLCFADDLLMFCKGDPAVVKLMMDGFKVFSATTGLTVNAFKSSIYCCGLSSSEKEAIAGNTGFQFGTLPFRYLGVPISACKLKQADCEGLVEKMVARIKVWSSRNISFAGRTQLVNSVLMSICVYWAQIFIFPKAVLKKINAICRSYLWHGNFDDCRPGAVAWDQLCWPKKQGGLGFKNLLLWNQAVVGKLAWAIAHKKDNLWVKWIHSLYIKDKPWVQFTPSASASWVVKCICQVKDFFSQGVSPQWLTSTKYSIKEMYQLHLTQRDNVQWHRYVWNRLSIPKHRFILWLATQDKLKTRTRLHKFGVVDDCLCPICGSSPETVEHLFFKCVLSHNGGNEVMKGLGFSHCRDGIGPLFKWLQRSAGTEFRRAVAYTTTAVLVYHVWKARKAEIWKSQVPTVQSLVKAGQSDVKCRVQKLIGRKVHRRDVDWFQKL